MSLLGIAIIGCGDMGTKHAAAWSEQDGAKVVAVCDTDKKRSETLSTLYAANSYVRWEDAIAQSGVDVVSICVPASYHRDIAVSAASAGLHILCEKPMALTMQQADDMMAATETNGVCLLICHQYRALSRFKVMKKQIDEGRIGSPIYIRFTEMREVRPKLAMHIRSLSGGPLHDMTGHLFDLGRCLTGMEAESVSAVGNVFAKGKGRVQPVEDFGVDTAEILVRFEGGHCLSICLNWGLPEGTPGHCHDLIHGPLGMVYSQDRALPDRFLGDPSDTLGVVLKASGGTSRHECTQDFDGPQACIKELVDGIKYGTRSQFDGREGRAALQLISATLDAIDTGKIVTLR